MEPPHVNNALAEENPATSTDILAFVRHQMKIKCLLEELHRAQSAEESKKLECLDLLVQLNSLQEEKSLRENQPQPKPPSNEAVLQSTLNQKESEIKDLQIQLTLTKNLMAETQEKKRQLQLELYSVKQELKETQQRGSSKKVDDAAHQNEEIMSLCMSTHEEVQEKVCSLQSALNAIKEERAAVEAMHSQMKKNFQLLKDDALTNQGRLEESRNKVQILEDSSIEQQTRYSQLQIELSRSKEEVQCVKSLLNMMQNENIALRNERNAIEAKYEKSQQVAAKLKNELVLQAELLARISYETPANPVQGSNMAINTRVTDASSETVANDETEVEREKLCQGLVTSVMEPQNKAMLIGDQAEISTAMTRPGRALAGSFVASAPSRDLKDEAVTMSNGLSEVSDGITDVTAIQTITEKEHSPTFCGTPDRDFTEKVSATVMNPFPDFSSHSASNTSQWRALCAEAAGDTNCIDRNAVTATQPYASPGFVPELPLQERAFQKLTGLKGTNHDFSDLAQPDVKSPVCEVTEGEAATSLGFCNGLADFSTTFDYSGEQSDITGLSQHIDLQDVMCGLSQL